MIPKASINDPRERLAVIEHAYNGEVHPYPSLIVVVIVGDFGLYFEINFSDGFGYQVGLLLILGLA